MGLIKNAAGVSVFPQTQAAYRKWWRATVLPRILGDYPDATVEDIDYEWMNKLDALVDDNELPRRTRRWTRR